MHTAFHELFIPTLPTLHDQATGAAAIVFEPGRAQPAQPASAARATRRQRRIAVLGAPTPTMEYARRALRALGCSPLMFEGLEELRSLGGRIGQFEMLLLVCPGPGCVAESVLVQQARLVVGHGVPLLVVLDSSARAASQLARGNDADDVVAGPFTFSNLHALFEGFMQRNGIRPDPARLEWGRYAFDVRTGMASIGRAEVQLSACDFDLALEFFYSLGRRIALQRLRAIVASHALREPRKPLRVRISDLQHRLGLVEVDGWRIECVPRAGYQLMAPATLVAALATA